jgi:hypothetical protein
MFFEVQFSSMWQQLQHKSTQIAALFCLLCGLLPFQPLLAQDLQDTTEVDAAPRPLINLQYFSSGANPAQGSIFWFGKVERGANYGDVRIAYDDKALVFYLHVFDRELAYDTGANAEKFLQWDGATLYLDPQADLASPLANSSVRFDAQINHWEPRTAYQRSFRWQKGAWKTTSAAFDTSVGYRGDFNVVGDDRGWYLRFSVPFTSLGLAGAPSQGTIWRMALALHDRDEVQGSALPDQVWPADMQTGQPQSWGHIRFGVPTYQAPNVAAPQTVSIRNGVDGVSAPDAHVGGHSICGDPFYKDYFGQWGSANYSGYTQINIQNQWDVADWPCFSKYYVTFPLNTLPADASIVKATLTMQMFGHAGLPGEAKRSYMQVSRVATDWSEQSITWNNAPPVLENYSWTWVEPFKTGQKNATYTWDLSRAVADAQAARQPLRLVIYSLEGDQSSGKYFWSADAGAGVAPVLDITWGFKGYTFSANPLKQVIQAGGKAAYELQIASLRAGESVSLEAGASNPPGLEVSISPQRINAPGGRATVTMKDQSDSQAKRVYVVPITARKGEETRTEEMLVFVNGEVLFMPSLSR